MRAIFTIAVLVGVSASVFAHEYWFEPDNFFIRPGQVTALHLFVGDGLKPDEERPYQASKTNLFQMLSTAGSFDVRTMAEDEKMPIMRFSANKEGTYLLSMERGWSYITLEPDKFDEYLLEDGMDDIISERERLGESKRPGRERYSRYIKTLIQVGDDGTGVAKTRIGSRLEIVPINSPYSKRVGDKVEFQVYFGGSPLIGKTVFADNRDGDQYSRQKLVTDKDGKVSVKIDRKGVWLIRLVYMQRCGKACGEADWESFWGALTFGVK